MSFWTDQRRRSTAGRFVRAKTGGGSFRPVGHRKSVISRVLGALKLWRESDV